jgi:hypothetical protein
VMMSSVSGPKLIELAHRSQLHDRPILLYSNRSEEELDRLARAGNASGFIRKTSDEEQLDREVDRWATPAARSGAR